MKPSPWACTLLASPASSALGDCIEKESSDSAVGNFDVACVIWTTAVDSSLASHDLYSEPSGLSLYDPNT